MTIQKFKMFVTVGVGKYNHGVVELMSFSPIGGLLDDSFGKRLISETEVEVDVPEFDLVSLEVDALEQMVQKEKADSQVSVNILLDRLSKLKAIGHDVIDATAPSIKES